MDDLETKPEGNKTDNANGDVNPDEDDDDDDDDDKAEEENNEDDGILFYVNKDGLPMKHDTWQRMWSHAAKLYPDAAKTINTIRNTAPEGEVCVLTLSPPCVQLFDVQHNTDTTCCSTSNCHWLSLENVWFKCATVNTIKVYYQLALYIFIFLFYAVDVMVVAITESRP